MTTKTAAALLLLSAAGVHGQTTAFDPAQTCEGKAGYEAPAAAALEDMTDAQLIEAAGEAIQAIDLAAECWHQLDSHPGCYVWNSGLRAEETASWSGACGGSVAEGEGVLTWAYPEGASVYEGALVGGKRHGRGRVTSGFGRVEEGTYANGLRSGRWRITYRPHGPAAAAAQRGGIAVGSVTEGIYANGRRTGMWVERHENGDVTETPYVNGEIHGTMVWRRKQDGDGVETPFVNGERHGTQVLRYGTGTWAETVTETPYVNDKEHGTEVQRNADGNVTRETPYVNGEKHGTEVRRNADGTVARIRYVNGERQDL